MDFKLMYQGKQKLKKLALILIGIPIFQLIMYCVILSQYNISFDISISIIIILIRCILVALIFSGRFWAYCFLCFQFIIGFFTQFEDLSIIGYFSSFALYATIISYIICLLILVIIYQNDSIIAYLKNGKAYRSRVHYKKQ